jgi:hypothetical protein
MPGQMQGSRVFEAWLSLALDARDLQMERESL